MRLITAFVVALVSANLLAEPSYPPPYPRPGTKALIDNARAQVWDVSWPKGEHPGMHRHLYAMTGLYYHAGDRLITAEDGTKRTVSTPMGRIQWQLKGITHIEEGTSDDSLRAVMIEIKGEAPSGTNVKTPGVAAFSPNTMPLLDNDRVTVWDYIPPVARHSHPLDTFVVWTEPGAGHAVFVPAGTVHDAEPIGSATKATIFELK
ncbi:MAG TPA: hypothetical protein VGG73_09470 [Vicinamibacterales bacterium]|jgi:hypothetical protein